MSFNLTAFRRCLFLPGIKNKEMKEQYVNHGNIAYKYHVYGVGRVGRPANMMVSHNDAKTFTSQSMNADCQMLFNINMLNTKEGFVCAANNADISRSNATILYTKDGSKTWQQKYQLSLLFEIIWKASFPGLNVGYVTIQSYNPDTTVKQQRVAKTIDGGETSKEIELAKDH
jgi:phage baseplate assembly protein W